MTGGGITTIRLPACERCKKSKIKCDEAAPKCSACRKSNTACITYDFVTGERYGREQLHHMQLRLKLLESRKTRSDTHDSPVSPIQRKTHYVGDGSGIDMFHRVSASAGMVEDRARVFEQLNVQSPRNELSIPSHSLPSRELANKLVERYCSHAHLLHPLITKQDAYTAVSRVYQPHTRSVSKQDIYTIFMISAISSVTMFRRGLISEHPYGFYRSAAKLLPEVPLFGSMTAVRNLLLIARFAMYYHIDCSIWDISRLCMRQCIELGFHKPSLTQIPALEEQARRNLFWDCYVHDRHSSGILGRPFAISESDICVGLPLEANEDHILILGDQSLDEVLQAHLSIPNEASIFHFVIRLRRIISRAHVRFFSPMTLIAPQSNMISLTGEILRDLERFLDELELCRQRAPNFTEPRSLYERSEWHQFMVEKDKLAVIRGAFARLSSHGWRPTQKLLMACLNCAVQVIELYVGLFTNGHITWTRSYFQILFTSGLSVMYAISQLGVESDDPGALQALKRASQALTECCALLSRFSTEMPDAERFAVVFEKLSRQYINKDLRCNYSVSDPESPLLSHSGYVGDGLASAPLDAAIEVPSTQVDEHIGYQAVHRNEFTEFEQSLMNFEPWSNFPIGAENPLSQMEAGMGQYAWGTLEDATGWEQYFIN